MKLKDKYIVQAVGDAKMAIPTGSDFNGVIKNNATADFIFQMLQNDTTEEAIVNAMLEKYDAPRDVIAKDVHNIISALCEKGFIEE